MSKKQFTLDSWLKDKSQKVVTRCGFPVRIVCTDVKRKDYPILALVEKDDQEEYQSFTKDGRFSLNFSHDIFDLFIETADEVSEDEKIRKRLIQLFQSDNEERFGEFTNKQFVAWLEKQDEKPADRVKPKFKVGDLVVDNCGYVWKIEGIINQFYILEGVEGGESRPTIEWVNKTFHLWTIQDAKDGDVLYINNTLSESIMIYKSFNNGLIKKYASYNKFGFEGEHYLTLNDGYITPATKEQCTELFLKMHEAGYEWDSDNKELKKIEDEEYNGEDYGIDSLYHAQRILEKTLGNVDGYQTDDGILSHKCAITAVKKLYEQKPTWSEEDTFKVQKICKYLDESKKYYADITEVRECMDWLKSLKERIGG